jgi:LmbE family N-acetylglucosaminyl deacetylase
MLPCNFETLDQENPLRLLCLGAHSDDIEIGCAGTVLKLKEQYPNLVIDWAVFAAAGVRAEEAQRSAAGLLAGSDHRIFLHEFRDGFFPYAGEEIKSAFEEIKRHVSPDLIFTHYRHDRHQDHRIVSDLTWNTFRNHVIWEYEIPKYDGDLGSPNVFVQLEQSLCDRKIEHLENHFGSQSNKSWYESDTFLSLMRLRGVESNAPSRYAEAFYSRKMVF